MDIAEKLQTVSEHEKAEAFDDLIKKCISPALGTMSKREFEILLILKLQEIKVIEKNPEIYDMVSSFKITRSKARSLLYDVKMRTEDEETLQIELIELLSTLVFIKDGDKIMLEVTSPYLIDYIKSILKKQKQISDGSFSPENIRLSVDAYITLVESCMSLDKQKAIKKALQKCGFENNLSFRSVIKTVLSEIGKITYGKTVEGVVQSLELYIRPILQANVNEIEKVYQGFL